VARITIYKIKPRQLPSVHRESSRARQVARKAGIDIPKLRPSLPETEQEETDVA